MLNPEMKISVLRLRARATVFWALGDLRDLCDSVVKSQKPSLDAEGCAGLRAPRDHQKISSARSS
jgi:hypothetical protein